MSAQNKKGRTGKSRWSDQARLMGLGGLTPSQAARGALFQADFQDMPDPLAEKDTLSYMVRIIYVTTSLHLSTLSTRLMYCTVDLYIYSCLRLSTLSTLLNVL